MVALPVLGSCIIINKGSNILSYALGPCACYPSETKFIMLESSSSFNCFMFMLSCVSLQVFAGFVIANLSDWFTHLLGL